MLTILESLFELLLVIGTSIWGWAGIALGFVTAYFVWTGLSSSDARGPVSAIAFLVVFMICAGQELRGGNKK